MSPVVQDGGRDPFFGGEEIFMWMDGVNWLHDLEIKYEHNPPPSPCASIRTAYRHMYCYGCAFIGCLAMTWLPQSC